MPHGKHTSIGFLALLISHLENNPHPPMLTRNNPLYAGLVCAVTHVDLPWYAWLAIKGSLISDYILWSLNFHLKNHPIVGKLIATTQAFTLSSGGVKVNVRPYSCLRTEPPSDSAFVPQGPTRGCLRRRPPPDWSRFIWRGRPRAHHRSHRD